MTERKNLHADSCLTNILRDSFGGNAKATIICAVSPGYKYVTIQYLLFLWLMTSKFDIYIYIFKLIYVFHRFKSGTLSTLRFGKKAMCIENAAEMNEITEDVVNDLTDQIRELKVCTIQCYFSGII